MITATEGFPGDGMKYQPNLGHGELICQNCGNWSHSIHLSCKGCCSIQPDMTFWNDTCTFFNHKNISMSENAAPADSCCPNCGWSESDEQGFSEYLEFQKSLPKPSRWSRAFLFIIRRFYISDFWYFSALLGAFSYFSDVFATLGIDAGFSVYRQSVTAAVPVAVAVFCRIVWHLADAYFQQRRLNYYFNE